MNTASRTTDTCGRMIAALDEQEQRTLRPFVKSSGHPGHCHYKATRGGTALIPNAGRRRPRGRAPVRTAAMQAWAWVTWLGWPLVTRSKAGQRERAAFRLGVDAGAFGQVEPSQAPSVRHLSGMPRGVVGVEIPPR